jgi:hypothetical protein
MQNASNCVLEISVEWERRIRMAITASVLSMVLNGSAFAIVGASKEILDANKQPEVMIVGDRGNFCTGTLIAQDVVLTAAHCVLPGANYMLLGFAQDKTPALKPFTSIARHPQFKLQTLLAHRATADVAVLKLEVPLAVQPAASLRYAPRVAVGDRFVLHGYGVAVRGDGGSGGKLRSAVLAATGQPGNLQLRLVDPATAGTRPGLGACTGDSGAPVYEVRAGKLAIYGVVSWSTGPNGEGGCGGLTGVTPLELYWAWVIEAAKKMGVGLAD